MTNRIAILEGYTSPFGGFSGYSGYGVAPKRKAATKGRKKVAKTKQQKRMGVCSRKCRGKGAKRAGCLSKCLRGGKRKKRG
jgi:hypothetical protein